MSPDEYVPSDQDIEDTYASTWLNFQNGLGRERFREWLAAHDARVKRDAAREALLALDLRLEPLAQHQDADGIWTAQGEIADMLTNDYPKEAP